MNKFLANKILIIFCIILSVIITNVLISFWNNSKIDCTKEKKYTLSNETKSILKKIDDKIFFKIYFEGKSFTNAMQDYRFNIERLLNELQYYSNLIEYDFVDINDLEKQNQVNLIEDLMEKGILVTDHPNLTKEKVAWGGYMTYGKYNYEEAIILLNEIDYYETYNCLSQPESEQSDCTFDNRANESQKNIEYILINSIKKAIEYKNQKSIGLLYSYLDVIETRYSHGNIKGRESWLSDQNKTKYLKKALIQEGYKVEDFLIDGEMINDIKKNNNINPLGKLYDCIIINQPINQFDDDEKIIIDQFIMHGGKTIWLIDGLQKGSFQENNIIIPNGDSYISFLKNDAILNFKMFLSTPNIETFDNNELDSMLMKYGVIINNDIIRDYINSPVEYPDRKLYDWDYYPTIEPKKKHPIVNNIQKIRARFASSIDTLYLKNIKKTPLLESSKNTIISSKNEILSLYNGRLRINPKERNPIDNEKYNNGKKIIAVLLEGKFDSAYKDYVWKKNNMKKQSVDNKMIVISDGDLFSSSAKINYNTFQELIYPLGYDPFNMQKFDNSSFAINCVNYLLEDKPNKNEKYLFEIKNKQINNYPFIEEEIKSKQKKWAIKNNLIPILIILIFGLINYIIRRKKYSI